MWMSMSDGTNLFLNLELGKPAPYLASTLELLRLTHLSAVG